MAVKRAASLASMKAEYSVDQWDEALVVTMDATKVAPKAEHSALTSVVTKELTMVVWLAVHWVEKSVVCLVGK